MTLDRFQRCLAWLRAPGIEGGFSNHPQDHGGPTQLGISTPIFDEAKRRGIIPVNVRTVREMTPAQSELVYHELFWRPAHGAELPVPLDLLSFDAFVQHRPGAAARLIQTAVLSTPDGVIGPRTIEAARKTNVAAAVQRYTWAREALYRSIVEADPSQHVFIKGWLARVHRIEAAAVAELPPPAPWPPA